jgi:hypothetical protein
MQSQNIPLSVRNSFSVLCFSPSRGTNPIHILTRLTRQPLDLINFQTLYAFLILPSFTGQLRILRMKFDYKLNQQNIRYITKKIIALNSY